MILAIGLLLLHVVLGLIFLAHGAQKLFGIFGGPGLAGTTQFMSHLGLQPAKFWAIVAALGEFIGGLLLTLGLITPLGALLVIGVMLVAIAKVHWSKGFWSSKGGYEYNLVLLTIAIVLGLVGAGAYSLDAVFGFTGPEPQTFLLSLIALLILLVIAIPVGSWIGQHSSLGHDGIPSSSNI